MTFHLYDYLGLIYTHRNPILEKAPLELPCGKENIYFKVTRQEQKVILRKAAQEGTGWPCPVSEALLPLQPLVGVTAPLCTARTGPSLSWVSFILSSEALPKSSQVITFGDMMKLGWVQVKDLSEVKCHFQASWPPQG